MLEHGGNLRDATRRFGRSDWLDLSTGLNPRWYPAPVLVDQVWHRLPEADPELAAAAAEFYGAPQPLLPVAGTQAAIQALPCMRTNARVVVAGPSYAEHAHQWAQHGHALREVPHAQLGAEVDSCDVMVVCNPNNPTGAKIAPSQLMPWADRLAERGGWLIVDEAFGETEPALSVAAHIGHPALIVLRSIGKFFGLAGVRLGFVGAPAALLQQLADQLGPWAVSTAAQRIALSALRDRPWQEQTRHKLAEDGARLRVLLAGHGITSYGTALFQWWPEPRAEQFWEHMAERGIWVRLFRQGACGIRLGLPPDDAGWQRLAQALDEWNS
jgi:cobalamin biosynthetic protein CobC